ncbi:unnamed protein product [Prorocentrum cordatum]|uniref:Uncharacterized protein n=1 Tax=Prorocentrum cordatum TaxID=2364126 RepID=A0ABN9QRQ8_9DINO|nr:unnamed protein product [Polarella glacialis]
MSNSIVYAIPEAISQVMAGALPGALEKALGPRLDELSKTMDKQIPVLSERVDAGMGSLPNHSSMKDADFGEQTVEYMREEFEIRFQTLEAQLALLGQKLDCATSAPPRLQSSSPGLRGGRLIDDAASAPLTLARSQSQAACSIGAPPRIEPRARPIDYSKFDNLDVDDSAHDLMKGFLADVVRESLGNDELPPFPGVD